jgi:glyoxylase-like metal-dependent hydrolase (beta-lactamase superfamily II)
MAFLSFLYPRGPINISERINILPAGGIVPGLPEWRIIHTPGHTPGHISLYREKDRVIIAGDALVTVRAESAMAIMRQKKKLHGPPKYFTSDWPSAGDSVNKIAALEPDIIATGHGQPMRGADMRNELNKLSWQFDRVAIPRQGRYVNDPALADESGVQYLPPGQEQLPSLVKIALVTATITLALVIFMRNRSKPKRREISVDIFRPNREFELN